MLRILLQSSVCMDRVVKNRSVMVAGGGDIWEMLF